MPSSVPITFTYLVIPAQKVFALAIQYNIMVAMKKYSRNISSNSKETQKTFIETKCILPIAP